ncbi:MAG: SufD family Fe-S cluster assembly protein [Candidatus Magasanikbacteria bacterium]|nr:SufD family Fe-S cluster assembly protein [Candidatus Magasanikbacteria bacterium]
MHILDKQQSNINVNTKESQDYLFICDGSKQFDVTVSLESEGASVRVYGLIFGSGDNICDVSVTVQHLAPHTTSEIMIIGAVGDTAKAKVKSKIYIAPNAYGSNGREEIRTLLLSKNANAYSTPELQIENNDVQCSHAVSTTHIDDEKKFYLESRGFDEKESKQAVVQGHFARLLEKVKDITTRETVEKIIFNKQLI